ncbi:MAG: hypothetical protein COW24_04390 [Candidatus Kerfeldbacteria bacterium CG15_BIG_FIL_POST_REV_8_21_14_020_45_12]|uniref:Uncharacterized protein n=1 Tax=Candidatus Kerfeldbacteria bacterium CG15_BIG_FIL_POST_REV_8_21_14_020_45_12 TaxID=2014247 RepID=A0A2M7H355_9BACT|nr:MAG: hypothetical protein COW24_04390 [Candidatus Kerfeldbacteria bacterium CG15_BIG_FIL_POST_REV_8_21_14_020_45_12]PJA93386.1 MAG: hypothetical protein CO132_03455 [Candidatus Kerfeldbacteria bacterium CG_4_9_14_3_um_filter_45_8]
MRRRHEPQPQRVRAVDMIGSLEPEQIKRYGELRPEAVDLMAEIYANNPSRAANFLAPLHLIDPELAVKLPATVEIINRLEGEYLQRVESSTPDNDTAVFAGRSMSDLVILSTENTIIPEYKDKAWDAIYKDIERTTSESGVKSSPTHQAKNAYEMLLIDPSKKSDIPINEDHAAAMKAALHKEGTNEQFIFAPVMWLALTEPAYRDELKKDELVLKNLRDHAETAWAKVQAEDSLNQSYRLAHYCRIIAAIALIKAESVELTASGQLVVSYGQAESYQTETAPQLPSRSSI